MDKKNFFLLLFFILAVPWGFSFELDSQTLTKLQADPIIVMVDTADGDVIVSALFIVERSLSDTWAEMINLDRCKRIYPEYESIDERFSGENTSDVDYVLRTPFKTVAYTLSRTYVPTANEFSWVLARGAELSRFDGSYRLQRVSESCTAIRYDSRMRLKSRFANFMQSAFVEGFARKSIRRLIRGIETENADEKAKPRVALKARP